MGFACLPKIERYPVVDISEACGYRAPRRPVSYTPDLRDDGYEIGVREMISDHDGLGLKR